MTADEELLGSLPALVVGAGEPLLFLGGLSADAGPPRPSMRGAILRQVAPFAEHRRVWFVNRRSGLPRGMTMAALAREHAEAIRAASAGPVDVVGLSTGGSIAQQLAADHPETVRRLVLGSTACRLGPHGREMQRRVAARVRRGAYRRALALLAAELVPPGRGQLAAGLAGALVGPRLFPDRGGLDDMATTIEAEDRFDLARCSAAIRAPTLIVAGEEDRFYSPELFAETAALIPGGRLVLLPGKGHTTALADPRTVPEALRFLAP